MKKIEVVPYDLMWSAEFKKAKYFYEDWLKDVDVEVVHVGSTSIKGLWAKPILDIDIIVNTPDDNIKVIHLLEQAGYIHRGIMGIEGREAFKYKADNPHISWMSHHLYVCLRSSESLTNHLLLRSHLRNNSLAVQEYSQLKRYLAELYPFDIDAYVEGKTKLITRFLEAEGMDSISIEKIEIANKKNNSNNKP